MSLSPSNVRTIVFSLFIILISGTCSPGFSEDSFALVVNHNNPFSGDRQETISLIARLFLKKGKMWPKSDITCRPFDRDGDSIEHRHFVQGILKMSKGRLAEHWAKMKQLRGDTPPRKIKTTRILLKLIQKNEGAFGIVSQDEVSNLPKDVRVLFFF